MRYFTLFILIFVFACSKKSGEESSQNPPPLSNYEVLDYLGLSVGKQHKYYAIDTIKTTLFPFIPETTSINQDTILRVISDTFGNLNVIYYDSVYSSGQKTYDTLYVYNPFVIDTIIFEGFFNASLSLNKIRIPIRVQNIILSDTKIVKIANKLLKAPLYLNDSWTPIESQSIVLNDTSKGQFFDCSLWVYVDTFKIDSSIRKVIEVGNDSTFKLFSKVIQILLYRYQQRPPCNDTTIQKSSMYFMSIDTIYLKPYLGIQRIIGFDSVSTSLFFFYVYQKTYRKRYRIGP